MRSQLERSWIVERAVYRHGGAAEHYLSQHVVLAYGTAVHAAEGRTVDICHALGARAWAGPCCTWP